MYDDRLKDLFRRMDRVAKGEPVPLATLKALKSWFDIVLHETCGIQITFLLFGHEYETREVVPLYELVDSHDPGWKALLGLLLDAKQLYHQKTYRGAVRQLYFCLEGIVSIGLNPFLQEYRDRDWKKVFEDRLGYLKQRLEFTQHSTGQIQAMCEENRDSKSFYIPNDVKLTDFPATLAHFQSCYIPLRKGWYADITRTFSDNFCDEYRRENGVLLSESAGRPSAKDHCLAAPSPFFDASPISILGSRWLAMHNPTSKREIQTMFETLRKLKISTIISLQEPSERSSVLHGNIYWPSPAQSTVEFAEKGEHPMMVSFVREVNITPTGPDGPLAICPEYVTIREFIVLRDGADEQTIYQFHLRSWEDYGLPNPVILYWFMNLVAQFKFRYLSSSSWADTPTAIHCHSGVGRTGTFILLFAIWQYYQVLKNTQVADSDAMSSSSSSSQSPAPSPASASGQKCPKCGANVPTLFLMLNEVAASEPHVCAPTVVEPESSPRGQEAATSSAPSVTKQPARLVEDLIRKLPEHLIYYRLQREGVQGAEQLSLISVVSSIITSDQPDGEIQAQLTALGRTIPHQRCTRVPVDESCDRYAAFLDASGAKEPTPFDTKVEFDEHLKALSRKIRLFVFGANVESEEDQMLLESWSSKLCKLGKPVSYFFLKVVKHGIHFDLLAKAKTAPRRCASESAVFTMKELHYGESKFMASEMRNGADVFYFGEHTPSISESRELNVSQFCITPTLLQRVVGLTDKDGAKRLINEIRGLTGHLAASSSEP